MGGIGSGGSQWWREERRPLVENYLRLDVFDLRKLNAFQRGRKTVAPLEMGDGCAPQLEYFAKIECDGIEGDTGIVTLAPCWSESETPAQVWRSARRFGGGEWYFRCPIGIENACGRSTRFLFIPPGGLVFGCRHCHRLVYRSSQTAGTWASRGVAGFIEKAKALLEHSKRVWETKVELRAWRPL